LLLLAVGVAAALAVWVGASHSGRQRVRLLGWQNLTPTVGAVEFSRPERHRFRKQRDFANFLRHVETGLRLRIPRVDFRRDEALLFAVGPRSSHGYSVRVREVRVEGGRLVVLVEEQSPQLGSPARPGLTYPFALITVPRSDLPVAFEWPQEP